MRYLLVLLLSLNLTGFAQKKPNVIIILADDLGFGEVQALNPKYGKIKTPELDSVIQEGMTFLDGHSASAVCTPTRYGLLTGRYAWRTRLQARVVKGGESIVAEETLTLADMFKKKGYHTAMFGKWHLGMKFNGQVKEGLGKVKTGEKVTEGPIDKAGFDEFHGFHYARQMDLWIDNDTVTRNIKDVDMLPELTKYAVDYIDSRKGKKQPFFMYIPWNAPHSPVVPSKEWKGKSGINQHADFVMQTDWSYGQVVKALKRNKLWENTLVIYSSDNGTSPQTSGKGALKKAGHNPSAQFRGMKSDIYDGGHRVPFIATWPKYIKAGSVSKDLVCLNDLMATFAQIIGYKLKEDEGVDSVSFLPTLIKGKNKKARKDLIHHSIHGYFAIRRGKWKLSVVNGSGGWGAPTINKKKARAAQKLSDTYQLYDMTKDESEATNLADQYPELVERLRKLLDKQIAYGRSTSGPKQKNDIEKIVVEKW